MKLADISQAFKAPAVGQARGSSREEYERSAELARRVEFLELALDQEFQEIYVEEMEFPGRQGGDDAG